MEHVITSLLPNKNIIFDIGANIGEKSQWFVDRDFHVICVEPQPAMVTILKEKFSPIIPARVQIAEYAISDYIGVTEMLICSQAPTISTINKDWTEGRFKNQFEWDQKQTVNVTTIDKLIQDFGIPNYCKIDIEGGELPAIRGLSIKVKYLFIEFTSEFIDNTIQAISHLEQIGFNNYNISISENPNFYLNTFSSDKNHFCSFLKNLCMSNPGIWGDVYASSIT